MSLKIRLFRIQRAHKPFFRIVIVDSRKPSGGKYICKIGNYNPLTNEISNFDFKKFDLTLQKGAIVTKTLRGKIRKHLLNNDSFLK